MSAAIGNCSCINVVSNSAAFGIDPADVSQRKQLGLTQKVDLRNMLQTQAPQSYALFEKFLATVAGKGFFKGTTEGTPGFFYMFRWLICAHILR